MKAYFEGFPIARIPSLHNLNALEQHVSDCAFLWRLRERAVRAPHYRMRNLLSLDRRIEANREGLVFAGDEGQRLSRSALDPAEPASIFVAALSAYWYGANGANGANGAKDRNGAAESIREVTQAAMQSPQTLSALIAALGWLPFERVELSLKQMMNASDARLHRIAIRAYGVQRRDPGEVLVDMLQRRDILVAAAAARTAGELRRRDTRTIEALSVLLASEAQEVRFWSAWSLVLLGKREGFPVLEATARSSSPDALAALTLLLLAVPQSYGRQFVSGLARDGRWTARATLGCGLLGDPSSIEWLIDKMDSPFARLAGEAFSMITGADLEYLDLDGGEPQDSQSVDDIAIDEQWTDKLPDPNPQKVRDWWRANEARFEPRRRYLCGSLVSRESLLNVLRDGYQRQRRVAALLLALSNADEMLFETRMSSDLQLRQQNQWN